MILERLYNEKLAQASYLIACQASKTAIVVDPTRDAPLYMEAAAKHGLRVTAVTETHIHADFVSGTRELAKRCGAKSYLSRAGAADWAYGFAAADGAELIGDGDVIEVGQISLRALHTPGHTPEHLCFLLSDHARGAAPVGILTGDCVFVGDVGRPDLLEKAASIAGTMDAAARALFASLGRFKELPDYLQLWPGHGAGSACGKSLSDAPQSTVGYEKLFNWALAYDDEEAFVEAVLSGQPEPPKYFAVMKRVNREGPAIRGNVQPPAKLSPAELVPLLDARAVVVDTRSAEQFAGSHVRGTLSLAYTKSFLTWAGWLLPYDRPLYLIADDSQAAQITRDLSLIGLDQVAGYFPSEVGDGAIPDRTRRSESADMSIEELSRSLRARSTAIIDVREPDEWSSGHIPGALNIPLGYLADRLAEIPRDRPVVVHCQAGARGAIAASILESAGYNGVRNVAAGFGAWEAAGLPVEK